MKKAIKYMVPLKATCFLIGLCWLPLGLWAQRTGVNVKAPLTPVNVEGDVRVRVLDQKKVLNDKEKAILTAGMIALADNSRVPLRVLNKSSAMLLIQAAGLQVYDGQQMFMSWRDIKVGKGARLDFTGQWGTQSSAFKAALTFSLLYVPGEPVRPLFAMKMNTNNAAATSGLDGTLTSSVADPNLFTLSFPDEPGNVLFFRLGQITFQYVTVTGSDGKPTTVPKPILTPGPPNADGYISIEVVKPTWINPTNSWTGANGGWNMQMSGSFKSIPILE